MKYITYTDLCDDIRNNLVKIPKDICGVIGIPRSGMLPATIISEYLNIGLATIDDFIVNGIDTFNKHGNRRLKTINTNKILVIDDTCYNGNEINKNRIKLQKYGDFEFIFLVVYMEGSGIISQPDIYLKDIREEARKSEIGIVLYEWNLLSNPGIINKTIFDLDGVICVDPPDERNTEEYIKYVKKPQTLFLPTVDKLTVCTYRLKKYREDTENYLDSLGYTNRVVYMFDADTYEERSSVEPWLFKATVYSKLIEHKLFIESNDFQARKIKELTGKPVFCVETNKMY